MSKGKGRGSQASQRANTKNPNNPAHKAAGDHRGNQMNPNNPASRGSRQGNKGAQK